GGASVTAGNDSLSNTSGVCPQITVSFPSDGSYTVTLEVRDHNGVNPYSTDTDNRTVNIGRIPTSVSVSPASITLQTGNANAKSFEATVLDQFGAAIPNAPVDRAWVGSAGGSLSA